MLIAAQELMQAIDDVADNPGSQVIKYPIGGMVRVWWQGELVMVEVKEVERKP